MILEVLEHYGVHPRSATRHEQSIRCPVHEERRASASLNLDKEVINCHACGFGGGALEIIQAKEHLDRDGAISFAEQVLGQSLSGVRHAPRKERPRSISKWRDRLFAS